jgi:hypothetical protein
MMVKIVLSSGKEVELTEDEARELLGGKTSDTDPYRPSDTDPYRPSDTDPYCPSYPCPGYPSTPWVPDGWMPMVDIVLYPSTTLYPNPYSIQPGTPWVPYPYYSVCGATQ